MKLSLRTSAPALALLLAALGPAVAARAQTMLVELTFDNSGDRLAQTGSAGTTFVTESGAVTFAAGFGGGTTAVFDGASSLQASDSPVTSAFTIAFWMKTTTDNGLGGGSAWFQGAGLVDGELPGDTIDWGLSQMGTRVAFGIGGSDRTIFSTSTVNTGAWIHVAATWSTLGTMSLYLNGSLEATYGLAGTGLRETANQFFVGRDLGGGTYTGSLDEVRIYGSVLSGGQIAALAAVPEPATYALMLTGVCALGLVMLRRRRAAA